MYIDLSVELSGKMPIFPSSYLSPVSVLPVATHKVESRSVQKISFNSHVGTHIDAPYHAIDGGRTIEDIPLTVLCGGCVRLTLTLDNPSEYVITYKDLLPFQKLLSNYDRVVLHTGWMAKSWGTAEYFSKGPYLDKTAAQLILDNKIKLLGSDFTNFDSYKDTTPGTPAPRHRELLGSDVILLENLYNLEDIPSVYFKIYALPIKVAGADGCPCRVVAEV